MEDKEKLQKYVEATQEQLDKMPEIVDDEAGMLTVEEMKINIEKDIEQTVEYIDKIQKDIENYKPQLELAERLWKKLENKDTYKKKESEWLFQDEEYWEIQYEQNLYKIRDERAKSQNTLEGFYTQKEMMEKSLVDLKEKLAKLGDDKNE